MDANCKGEFRARILSAVDILGRENSSFNPEIMSCGCGERNVEREREKERWVGKARRSRVSEISSNRIRPVDDPSLTGYCQDSLARLPPRNACRKDILNSVSESR